MTGEDTVCVHMVCQHAGPESGIRTHSALHVCLSDNTLCAELTPLLGIPVAAACCSQQRCCLAAAGQPCFGYARDGPGLGMVMAMAGGYGWVLVVGMGWVGAWVTRTALATGMGVCRDGDGSGLGAGDGPVRGSGDQGLA